MGARISLPVMGIFSMKKAGSTSFIVLFYTVVSPEELDLAS
jgi:hypothetical protein